MNRLKKDKVTVLEDYCSSEYNLILKENLPLIVATEGKKTDEEAGSSDPELSETMSKSRSH